MIALESTDVGSIQITAPSEAGVNVDAYNAFVTALELAGIDLVKVQGERTSPGGSSQSRFSLSAEYMLDGEEIHYRYDVAVHFLNDIGNVVGNASASVLLVAIAASGFEPAFLERFGATSGAMMAHPYLREAIASTAQRIGFPGVLLPMMTYQPDDQDAE